MLDEFLSGDSDNSIRELEEDVEQISDLRSALLELREDYRQAVLLFYEGYTQEQIAEKMNMSRTSVWIRQQRGFAILKTILSKA